MGEAARITHLLELNDQSTYVGKIQVSTLDEFHACVDAVKQRNPDKIIMLLAVTEEALFVASLIPAHTGGVLNNWLDQTMSAICTEALEREGGSNDSTEVVSYLAQGEQSPEKLAEVVMGNAFYLLKKSGCYIEPEDEVEYGFDDI